jgi:putative ABC transport system substrate-binding protein
MRAHNGTFDRTAGSRSLAAAGQHGRWADQSGGRPDHDASSGHFRSRWWIASLGRTVVKLAVTRPVTALLLLLLAAPLGMATAQPPQKVPRVGYLKGGSPSDPLRQRWLEAFRQGLRELGYVEGQNIAIESRWTEGKDDRLPALAADLVRSKVDVIVAETGAATRAAQQATRTIPIVMSLVNDPVGGGLVASLARPGGNVTGLTIMSPDLVGKQLELLKEAVPKVSRVALLRHPDNPASAAQLREAEAAAQALGVRLQSLEARSPQEIDGAFAAMTRERAGALLVIPDTLFWSQRRQIAELAVKRRLPSMRMGEAYAEAGGLMSYGPSYLDLERRAATFVDKILKGANPADLPVAQPTKFELVINMKTAKASGIAISDNLLSLADGVIE